MSSWSEIRSRTTDPLSSTINSLILRQNQANAITSEITDSETIFPVRILNSKLSLNDKDLVVGYSKPVSQAFFMPFEPDGGVVKLWTRFDSGGVTVQDYSFFGNNIEVRHDDAAGAPQPQLLMTAEDDGIAKNKISSYLDKSFKHYFRVTDPQFQLSSNNEQNFTFFFKIYPTLLNNVENNGKRAILLDYIENDQVSHAVRVELDDEGYLYFFVRWNYIDYYVKSAVPFFTFPDFPDYFAQDYAEEDYYASEALDPPFTIPLEFEYIFCTFNKDTKVVKILHPTSSTTCDIWSGSGLTAIPQSANLSLWMPLSGGGGIEQPQDISGFNNDGSFSAVAADRKPSWTTITNRRFLEFGERDYFTIPKTASLNTLTTGFTISLFLYLHSDYYSIAHSKVMFGSANSAIGRVTLYSPSGSSRALNLDVSTNASVSRFLGSGGTPLPASTGSWAHIVVTYDGTNYKFYCNKVQTPTTSNFAGDQFTNSNPMYVGSFTDNSGGHSNISNVMFWKNVALSQSEINTLYDTIYPSLISPIPSDILLDDSQPMFPPGYDEPPAPPAPGTPTTLPFTQTQYDQQTGTAFAAIKPVTVSGLTAVYTVAGGDAVTDPVVLQYNVPEGTGGTTTNPFTTIYDLALPGSPSTGTIDNTEFAYGQGILTTSSVLYNKAITRITVYLKSASAAGGTLNLGIIKANGTTIAFGTAIPLSGTGGLTSSYTAFTRTNTTNTYLMQVGDVVGAFWSGGTGGAVNVHRGGTGVHYENTAYSHQHVYDGTDWRDNPDYSMAGKIETGGDTTGTTPWITINTSSQYIIGETFSSTSAVANKAPTKVELKVKKKSGTTGTLYLQIVTSAGALKSTLKTWNIATDPAITTSDPAAGVLNLVWEDLANSVTIATNERLVLGGGGTLNVGGEVYVMSNIGNNTVADTTKNHNSTSSYIMKRSSAGTWSTYNTSLDITGKISTGGNDFTGYIELNDTRKRTGIKVDTDTSTLKTKKITKVTATLKKVGSPTTGAIYCRIRNSAGTIKETINQVDVSAISTTDTSVNFINVTHNTTLALDDTLSLEYDLGDSSNYIAVRVNKNQFEGVNTILFESLATSINTASPVNDRDLAAILYTGGETDLTARPRVGLSVNNSNSSLWGKAITKVRVWLKREGSTFGAGDVISVKIIRGSDKVVVSTLGTQNILAIAVTPSTGNFYDFENTGNSYVMADGDMIVVENTFGNSSNYVWVKKSDTNVIDDTSTCFVDWNSTAYNLNTSWDLNAVAWTGGYTVYPDPSIPTPPTPYHYSHEIFIGSATTADSGTLVLPSTLEPDPDTMFNFIAADFRVYQGRLIGEEEALNLFKNKYTISGLEFTEVNTVAHSLVAENPP